MIDLAQLARRRLERRVFDARLVAYLGALLARAKRVDGRHERQRDRERGEQREADRERLILDELAGQALDEDERQEHRDGRERRGDHGTRHQTRAGAGRGDGVVPLLLAPENTLEHDDAAIDHHSHGEGKTAQRHEVQREAEAVHEDRRDEDRHRNGERDDEGRAQIAQEREQHQNREQTTDESGADDVVDRVLNEARLVGDGHQLHLGRQLKTVETPLDDAGHADRVGVTLFEDGDLDGLFAVDAGDDRPVLGTTTDIRDIGDTDEPAVAGREDHIADLRRILELVRCADQVLRAPFGNGAAGEIHVLLTETLGDIGQREPDGGKSSFIDLDLDLLLFPAGNLYGRDTGNPLQVSLDRPLRNAAQSLEVFSSGEAQPQNGIERWVEAKNGGPLGLARQHDEVELFAHGKRGHIHAGSRVELENHLGLARPRDRVHPNEPLHDTDPLLDGAGDELLDVGRSRVLELGTDGQRWIRDVGE